MLPADISLSGDAFEFNASIEGADLAKMAKLVKLVGMLSQRKVYLFWKKDHAEQDNKNKG